MIRFSAPILCIQNRTIVVLPLEASGKLPSRGLVVVQGSLDRIPFVSPLEPDGRGSHWFFVDDALLRAARVGEGDNVELELENMNKWPEPTLPEDLRTALDNDVAAQALWQDITTMARWDWIRWIQSTNNPDTRARHIAVAFSKLKKGTKRPCCFNRSMCTDMSMGRRGVLMTS